MKTVSKIPSELLTSIDMINTLAGGVAQAQVKLQQFETHRQISIQIPSLELDLVKVEIQNNVLLIYYFIPLKSQNQEHKYPKVIYNKAIPYFIDRDGITATVENNELNVRLPLNELAGGFNKQIPISY